ncbi:urea carboxylase [Acidicapsa acidisoli]|uniref:urea carboxylase n=1 Tax=Acidicapsa acidisoli TaxID=1615681 RepID=UPI0021DF7CFB|nr:urea carboxylase [Acidicapsa acidisoli]
MFDKVLIANRGAIACRILRTLKKMGIASVSVYSEVDANSRHVLDADEAYCIGPAPAAQSYLSIDTILKVAKASGAKAIHPGYGFLSENIEFARACASSGIVFIGPGIDHMNAFALKHTARQIAVNCGVPLLPGTGLLADKEDALASAEKLGYPVMLKSSAGGGGIGMRVCFEAQQLADAYDSVVRLSRNSFGDGSVYLEKFIANAKHVEVQIFGDNRGGILTLGARDCSAQRRHQKVIEETPVPGLAPAVQEQLFASARLLGQSVNYRSAGTVEFLFDVDSNEFYFLEVNTRLQVEHGVTEQVTGLDLVEMMILESANELPPLTSLDRSPQGNSIEARIYAEDPAKGFQPAPGKLSEVIFPNSELARTETWVECGTDVTPYYDPMIAKIIVTGADRAEAVLKMMAALDTCSLLGTETNLRYLKAVVSSPAFIAGEITTSSLSSFNVARHAFEVIEPGTQTTIQDYPGRLGYWHVGVPPSGPMDSFAMRVANRLVGNEDHAPALEMTGIGAKVSFNADGFIAICGADMSAKVNQVPVPLWTSMAVAAGDTLQFSAVNGHGSRTYLAIHGGFEASGFLGSASTFMLGRFGGHAGRALRAGDVIHFKPPSFDQPTKSLSAEAIPRYDRHWDIAVLYGPHGAPEFFTEADIEMIFSTDWRVHYQSDRTGVRLIGPKPEWARKDGGEAGLHPSNIHDNAYAIGAIDFTGDMPILLGPDGPSLGGFVCPAVVVSAELWKLGQLKAGDTIRFHRVSEEQARQLEANIEHTIKNLAGSPSFLPENSSDEEAILQTSNVRRPSTAYRADGDKYLLIEYGDKVLDLALRFRVHLLEQKLRALQLNGIIDITPGVRSLQVHYDNRKLPRVALLEAIDSIDRELPEDPNVTVPSRTVYMPLSWNDPATQLAQSKYMNSVRPDAPWCPDNIEFIRRINGLNSVDDVYNIVHAASYLVLGLGDVYLGAPVATPTDPRHRLITTKYNPARTWTPENAVGIGGAYMCVYGMEGPGGYQLVGRTVQVWNTYRTTKTFPPGTPWALRFFDQIRFYPVSGEELLDLRSRILHGGFDLRTEENSFNLHRYQAFLHSIAEEADAFRSTQREAFHAERERWRVNGLLEVNTPPETPDLAASNGHVPDGAEAINSPMTASVFQIAVELGQHVVAGAKLVVLEAMKAEIVIPSSSTGVVEEIRCAPGKLVNAGQTLVVVRPD